MSIHWMPNCSWDPPSQHISQSECVWIWFGHMSLPCKCENKEYGTRKVSRKMMKHDETSTKDYKSVNQHKILEMSMPMPLQMTSNDTSGAALSPLRFAARDRAVGTWHGWCFVACFLSVKHHEASTFLCVHLQYHITSAWAGLKLIVKLDSCCCLQSCPRALTSAQS